MVMAWMVACVEPPVDWEGTLAVAPADGAEHVPPRQVVTVRFSSPPPEDTRVWIDGGAAYTEVWTSSTEWSATPTSDYSRDATHHVLVDVAGQRVVTGFHTVGPPVDTPLVGRTYEMNLEDTSNLTWLVPDTGWGLLLSRSLGETHSVLLMIAEASPDALGLLGAAGVTTGGLVTQSPEIPSWQFDPADFADNPVIDVVAPEVCLGVGGADYALYDLEAQGEFAPDGEAILGFHVTTLLDARPIEAGGVLDVCGTVGCESCPDQAEGADPGCVALEFVLAETPWIEGLTLVSSAVDCSSP